MSRQYLCLDTPSTTVYLLNWSTSNKHYGPNWAPYCHLNEKLKEIKWIIFQSHQSPRLTFGGKGTIKTVQMFTINVSRTPPHGKLRLCNLSPWTKLKPTNLCCKCNQYQNHWWNYKKKKREKNKQKKKRAMQSGSGGRGARPYAMCRAVWGKCFVVTDGGVEDDLSQSKSARVRISSRKPTLFFFLWSSSSSCRLQSCCCFSDNLTSDRRPL